MCPVVRPNLNALRLLAQRQAAAPAAALENRRFLGVAWPGQRGNPQYLEHARQEVETIGQLFSQPELLLDQSATMTSVVRQAPSHQVIHFGCHGWFETDFPEQSGLMLADGWLTIYQILSELRLQARLVTVGACLSGQARVRTGDEFTGLTQALLSSGAGAVTSSLWSVPDQATRVLFENCYALIAGGVSVCDALQAAAQHVRQQPGWEHPYYWAAFQVSGLSVAGQPATAKWPAQQPAIMNGPEVSQRGGGVMDTSALITNVQSILLEINENQAEVLEALTPARAAQFLQAMEAVAAEASLVADEAGLRHWATRFFAVLEQYPAVKELLLEDGPVLAADLQRKISQSQFTASATQNALAQESAAQMRNAVLDCRDKLLQSLRAVAADAPPRQAS